MVLAVERTQYPTVRPRGLPASPLQFVRRGFEGMLVSPHRAALCAEWTRFSVESCRLMLEMGYPAARDEFNAQLADFIAQGRPDLESLEDLMPTDLYVKGVANLRTLTTSSPPRVSIGGNPAIERFSLQLNYYVTHDISHNSPAACLQYMIDELTEIMMSNILAMEEIPASTFKNLGGFINGIALYFESHVDIGRYFFAEPADLPSARLIRREEFEKLILAAAYGQALRFALADFKIVHEEDAVDENRNTISIKVDPQLHFLLPLVLLIPKIAANIKNAIRIVHAQERETLHYAEEGAYDQCALVMSLRGQKLTKSTHVLVEASQISEKAFEIKTSDNGNGIIVEQLFKPLSNAAQRFPEAISPALRTAIRKWDSGDPFAFNNIPYGDLLEAVYQLGVSTGAGKSSVGQATGMGLWGTMALLTKLGAQIEVGVNSKTGGFYESIILPTDLSVSPAVVKRAANRYFAQYS